MGDESGVEFKPSRTIQLEEPLFLEKKEELVEYRKRVHEALETGSKEKSAEFLQIEELAKENIIRIHKEAGVSISQDNFPPVYILAEQNAPEVFEKAGLHWGEDIGGGFNSKAGAVIIIEESPFGYASTVHHELMHSIGKRVVSPHVATLLEGQPSYIGNSQLGYKTGGVQGQVLEEATCEYFSEKFALQNDSELIKDARENAAKRFLDEVKIIDYRENFMPYAAEAVIASHLSPQYKRLNRLISRLTLDIGEEFQPLLLKTRVEPQYMRQLTSLIDNKYGKGTTREILHTEFEDRDLGELVNSLYRRIPREPILATSTIK